MPEKCAPAGYSNGWLVLVHVLLMMTVYSAGVVVSAGAGGAAGGLGASLPHATRRTTSASVLGRRMSPRSVGRTRVSERLPPTNLEVEGRSDKRPPPSGDHFFGSSFNI